MWLVQTLISCDLLVGKSIIICDLLLPSINRIMSWSSDILNNFWDSNKKGMRHIVCKVRLCYEKTRPFEFHLSEIIIENVSLELHIFLWIRWQGWIWGKGTRDISRAAAWRPRIASSLSYRSVIVGPTWVLYSKNYSRWWRRRTCAILSRLWNRFVIYESQRYTLSMCYISFLEQHPQISILNSLFARWHSGLQFWKF